MRNIFIIIFIFISLSLTASEITFNKFYIEQNQKIYDSNTFNNKLINFINTKGDNNKGKNLRNAGIGLFIGSMTCFTIFIGADIAAIVLSEEELIFPNGDYDWRSVRNAQWAMWILIAGFGVAWISLFIPSIILWVRGHRMMKGKAKKFTLKQWYIPETKSVASAFAVEF